MGAVQRGPVDRVRRAADATIAARFARVQLRSDAADAARTTMTAVGGIDFATRRSWTRLTMPPDVATSPGEAAPIEVASVIDGADVFVEVLELPGRWMRTRLDDHGEPMPAGDPGLVLDWLRGCTRAIPVADDPAAPELDAFEVTLDLDRAVAAAPEGSRGAIRSWIEVVAPDDTRRDACVWLDEQDRLHRLTFTDPQHELTLVLTAHGEPVVVRVPDPEAVIEPDQLLELLPPATGEPEEPPTAWGDPGGR